MINLPTKIQRLRTVPESVQMIGFRELNAAGLGCRNSILRKLHEGDFPWPYIVNGKKLWLVSDIEDYCKKLPKWNPADPE